MNTYANKLKSCLLDTIKEMDGEPQKFSTFGKGCFSRPCKFGFEILMRFILSFGSNSLGYKIGEFFEYEEGFVTASTFVQQSEKLSYTAFKYLFNEFNKCNNVVPDSFRGNLWEEMGN